MASSILSALLNLSFIRPFVRHSLSCPKPQPAEIFFATSPGVADETVVETLVPLVVTNTTSDEPEEMPTQSIWDFGYTATIWIIMTMVVAYVLDLFFQWFYAYLTVKPQLKHLPPITTCNSVSTDSLPPSSLNSITTVVNNDPLDVIENRTGAGMDYSPITTCASISSEFPPSLLNSVTTAVNNDPLDIKDDRFGAGMESSSLESFPNYATIEDYYKSMTIVKTINVMRDGLQGTFEVDRASYVTFTFGDYTGTVSYQMGETPLSMILEARPFEVPVTPRVHKYSMKLV